MPVSPSGWMWLPQNAPGPAWPRPLSLARGVVKDVVPDPITFVGPRNVFAEYYGAATGYVAAAHIKTDFVSIYGYPLAQARPRTPAKP